MKKAKNLSKKYGNEIYLKREDLNHTGAHKINHALGEGLLAKKIGKKKTRSLSKIIKSNPKNNSPNSRSPKSKTTLKTAISKRAISPKSRKSRISARKTARIPTSIPWTAICISILPTNVLTAVIFAFGTSG